jgi:F0F1-type ATP synthase membrane subunit a
LFRDRGRAINDLTKKNTAIRTKDSLPISSRWALCSIGTAIVNGLVPSADDGSKHDVFLCVDYVILINVIGIYKRGLKGRAQAYIKPNAIIAPFKLISDLAVPISLACRLFGNMLGGMIVVELVYFALGAFSVGIPAVLGLYFNAFHPLIQFFIFINLSLTFIGEAVEEVA